MEKKEVDDSQLNPGHPDNKPDAVAARIAQAHKSAEEAKAANAPEARCEMEPGAGGCSGEAGGDAMPTPYHSQTVHPSNAGSGSRRSRARASGGRAPGSLHLYDGPPGDGGPPTGPDPPPA